jgi:hypothetical protein
VVLFPYEWMFRTVNNYLLLDQPLDNDSSTASQQVLAALAQGQSYVVNRLHGTTPDIPLRATRGDEVWHLGDSPALNGEPLTLHVDAGPDTEARLIHNGLVILDGTGPQQTTITQPGVYRLEGHRNGFQWLFTNPIFVVD